MSFKDCIDTALGTGKVSPAKAETGKAAYDAAYAKQITAGLAEPDAALQAAIDATERMTRVTKERRWQKVNEIQRAHEIHTRLHGAKNLDREVTLLMEELELTYDSVMGMAMANASEFIVEYSPRNAGLTRPTAGLDEIPHAAFGESTDPTAIKMYEAIKSSLEVLRAWANRMGANIPDNPKNVLFQTHDAVKVSSVQREEWVNDHLTDGILDWETMRYAGEVIEEGDREEILGKVYDAIISDGIAGTPAAQRQAPNLANRLNRDRFLYYANGNAWNLMQKKYGAGNVHQQLIGMFDAMARDISIMKVFGPSPDTMLRYTQAEIEGIGAAKDLAIGANERKELAKARRIAERAEEQFRIHSRHVPTLESNAPIQAFSTVKTVAVNAVLGSLFVPSFIGDAFNSKTASLLLDLPSVKFFREYFSEASFTKEKRIEAMEAMVIQEHSISVAANRIRYFGLMDGPAWARNITEFTYRAGLTSLHTQIARNARGKSFLGMLARHRKMQYDDLPFASFMAEHQITKADWDAFRTTPPHVVKGVEFLRPLDFIRAGNAEAGLKFANMMQAYIKVAVPDASLRARAAIGEALDPNKPVTQGLKAALSLTSHPLTVYFNHMQRIRFHRNPLRIAAQYFAWMTVGGMFITQAKALLNGENLYNMTPLDDSGNLTEDSGRRWLDFMGRSVLNGGSLGILGDAVFNTVSIANSEYRPGNPTEEYLKSLLKLTIGNVGDVIAGEETNAAKEALDFASKNVPEFWQIKLLMRRYIKDELLRMADPAAYERKVQYQQEATEDRGTWWGMDE